jgi:hypothetical protein
MAQIPLLGRFEQLVPTAVLALRVVGYAGSRLAAEGAQATEGDGRLGKAGVEIGGPSGSVVGLHALWGKMRRMPLLS